MMFGTIMTSGMQMLAKAGFNQRNVTIAALSLAVGVGFTAASEIDLWHIFPRNCAVCIFRKRGSGGIRGVYHSESGFAEKYGCG